MPRGKIKRVYCHFCGSLAPFKKRVEYCPHIAFCCIKHCPTILPYCHLCTHDHSANPFLAKTLLDDTELPNMCDPILLSKTSCDSQKQPAFFPDHYFHFRLNMDNTTRPVRQAAQRSKEATKRLLKPNRPICYTCAKVCDEYSVQFCPHIYFCSYECSPCAQPVCYLC